MNLIYKDVDITDQVEIKQADIYDNAGGRADSIELAFADPEGLWSRWKPQKGDEIKITEDGFPSGKMFVDELGQKPGLFIARAKSTPLNCKSERVRSWEKIRFLKIAGDLAMASGLQLKTYDIENWLYDRIDQANITDLELLNRLCIREGYALKITDGYAVVYDERKMEQTEPVMTINNYDLIGNDYLFEDTTNGLKQTCHVRYMTPSGELIEYKFTDSTKAGGILPVNERVSSQGEAERFAKGYLRSVNKFEKTGRNIAIKLTSKIAAGNMVEVSGVGMADGLYFVDKVVQRLTMDRTVLFLRKPLEGY